MNCKKDGSVRISHNDLRDLTAKRISGVCKDTGIEPELLLLSGKELHRRKANRSNEARLNIRACGFWEEGQQAFFDIRIFDPSVCGYLNKSLQYCNAISEQDKNRLCNKRVFLIRSRNVCTFDIFNLR